MHNLVGTPFDTSVMYYYYYPFKHTKEKNQKMYFIKKIKPTGKISIFFTFSNNSTPNKALLKDYYKINLFGSSGGRTNTEDCG